MYYSTKYHMCQEENEKIHVFIIDEKVWNFYIFSDEKVLTVIHFSDIKTWLMKEFGTLYYKDFVYISFYNNSRMSSIFEEDYDVKRIINAIEVNQHVKITPGETLLIFDEVQNALNVVESLKYFCEDVPEYHIIAAGSLLGVSIHP